MATINETNIKPIPEGYTHYGPENGGATLPSGTDFMDSMNKAGWQSTTGSNPYYPGGAPSGGSLSQGGTPQETASQPTSSPLSNIGSPAPAPAPAAPTAPTTPTISELSLGGQSTPAPAPQTDPTTDLQKFLQWTTTPEGQQWAATQNQSTTQNAELQKFLQWTTTPEGQQWAAAQNGTTGGTGGTPGTQPTSVTDFLTWAATTPEGQSFTRGTAATTAKTEFTDQGDGVYRGWSSTGPATTYNTDMPDGSVQGQFRDTRGNEFRGDYVGADAMGTMSVEDAAAAAAAQNNRTMTQEEMSSKQLNDILSQDSPLMALARQQGINQANTVGLRNSSLAAGASMGAMAERATPLALQQAEAYRNMQTQNQALESSRLEQNAGREQQTSLFNAESQNAATSQEYGTEADRRKTNSALETQTNLTNAGMANDLLNADRQRSMSYALQQLAGDQDFAKQKIASQTAVDIANIEGQYKQLISENDTAARMFGATYEAIADVMSNPEIFADEATAKINYLIQTTEAMLQQILSYEDFDFEAATSTGDGKNSNFG